MLYYVYKEMPLPKRGSFNNWRAAKGSLYFLFNED